jgi:hypothetical protein
MRWVVVIALVAAAAAASAVILFTAGPTNARERIVGAALSQTAVHFRRTVSQDMVGTYRSWAEVNADSGSERREWFGRGVVLIRFVDGTVYVRADAAGLERTFPGWTSAQARPYIGRWISLTPKDEPPIYDDLADGLTLGSIVRDAIPDGKFNVSRTTSRGRRLLVLQRTDGERAQVEAAATGKPLPVSFSSGEIGGEWGHFSKWNEPVHVAAPATSVPIATVRGS